MVAILLAKQHKFEPLFSKAITMDVVFYMPQSKTVQKKEEIPAHAITPDLDNLLKFLNDAIQGVLITDDKLICSVYAKKVYDSYPRTEFVISEVS